MAFFYGFLEVANLIIKSSSPDRFIKRSSATAEGELAKDYYALDQSVIDKEAQYDDPVVILGSGCSLTALFSFLFTWQRVVQLILTNHIKPTFNYCWVLVEMNV